jgi:CubicO group peptidase (beta-lactamase class C family)
VNLDAALAYARKHALHALVVCEDDRVVLEVFENGHTLDKPHALYSGTKSFWGVVARVAEREGLLSLDELVCNTIDAWRDDDKKSRVTIRELLQLTSGFGFGGLGAAVPTYERALAMTIRDEPGSRFTYGGIPLQVFGAVLERKLALLGMTPHAYLRDRVCDPAGVTIASWRTLSDGRRPLPTGAFLTAASWLAYGKYVLAAANLAACFTGSAANPRYGLGWWLAPPKAPPDAVYASGSGGQALYVVPSRGVVVVHFGKSASFNHGSFLRALL